MTYGLDLLGLARMDIKMLKKNLIANTAIGCLMGTFGNPLPKLQELVSTGKVPAVRIHLTNGPCQRNKNCEVGEIGPREFDKIQKRLDRVKAFADKNPSVVTYVSPRLEHDEKSKEVVNKWVQMITAVELTPVICAASGFVPKGVLVEKHGNKDKAAIVSNDGEQLSDAPQDYAKHGKLITFAWLATFNGRGTGDEVFIPPSKRPSKAFADAHDIQYCNLWFQNIGAGTQIKSPEIFKPYCEYYSMHDDVRERKPVYLSKIKVDKWDICTRTGKKVSTMKYYPGDFGDLKRYYSTDFCDVLFKKLGHTSLAVLKSGDKKILVNILYRQGKMR